MKLSEKQIKILNFAAQGKSNKEIGVIMELSERTIKNYFTILFKQVGARNRTHAVALTFNHLTIDKQ